MSSSLLPSWCPPYSPQKTDPATGSEVYCVCKKPDEGELMVGCDGCDDWFHFKCMKIPEKYSHLVSAYFCPYCQLGITGKDKDNVDEPLPRTKWKRKCRLDNCYEPCHEASKYCSEEHGKEYMRRLLDKVNIPTRGLESKEDFVSDMVQMSGDDFKQFNCMGGKDFIDRDIPQQMKDKELFDKIIGNDKELNSLHEQIQLCKNKTYPDLKANLEHLQKYIAWLEDITSQLNTETNSNGSIDQVVATEPTKSKKKKSKKKATQRNKIKKICGYNPEFMKATTIPNATDFVNEYRRSMEEGYDQDNLNGVCIKLKCNKHADWGSMGMDQLKQQMRSLENHKERLLLLAKTRQRQLHIQYYEFMVNNQS